MESPQTTSKRRWFQLHLSTCLFLLLVAGVLVMMNIQTRKKVIYLARTNHFKKVYVTCSWGWPLDMNEWEKRADLHSFSPVPGKFKEEEILAYRYQLDPADPNRIILEDMAKEVEPFCGTWDILALSMNIIFSLSILTTIAYVLEAAIRRRSAKAQPQN